MTTVQKAVLKPCPGCPFSRSCPPGELGGSPPEVYIGQAFGPFVLPCHNHCDFDDPEWKSKAHEVPQCAGAAIYRTNTGRAETLAGKVPLLPENKTDVFGTPAEFLAHHSKVPLEAAEVFLSIVGAHTLYLAELRKLRPSMLVMLDVKREE